MKKLIALALVLTLALSLAACTKENGKADAPAEDTVQIASSLELLQNAYNSYANPENRPVYGGGSGETASFEGPGAVAITDTDTMTYMLKVPADQTANVSDCASMLHMMNQNNFTSAAFKVTGDKDAFVSALKDEVLNTNWMCGFPEKLVIATVGDYVVLCFGLAGVMEAEANFVGDFVTALTTAYPTAKIVVDQEIL